MDDWWAYLAQLDFVPVSPRVWQRTVERFGAAAGPWPALACTALAVALGLAWWRRSLGWTRAVPLLLAAAWAAFGRAFFGGFVAELTWAGPWAMGASFVQAGLAAIAAASVRAPLRGSAALLVAVALGIGTALAVLPGTGGGARVPQAEALAVVTLAAAVPATRPVRWLLLPLPLLVLAAAPLLHGWGPAPAG